LRHLLRVILDFPGLISFGRTLLRRTGGVRTPDLITHCCETLALALQECRVAG
jgi:hypothetical protein